MQVKFLSAQIGTVKRSKGENAVAAAAYNSRSKLILQIKDKQTGLTVEKTWDYRNKPGLTFSKIYVPVEDPEEWMLDREKLWNKAEDAEKRVNSTTAHRIMLPLPNELTTEENIALLEELIAELTKQGMIVDVNIHEDNLQNKHAHLLGTMRLLVRNRYNEWDFSTTKHREWQHKDFVIFVRKLHETIVNKHYELKGIDVRFCADSYEKAGIDKIPTVHEGPARNIKNAELVKLNLEIAAANAEKLRENPEVIVTKLAKDKPVFTKEQIAAEIQEWLDTGIDFSRVEDPEKLNKELSELHLESYHKILKSDAIEMVAEEDMKGRTLYASTRRLKLEERFEEHVKGLSNKQNHSIKITATDIETLTTTEELKEKVRTIAESGAKKLETKTGLKINVPNASPELNEEQKRAVINILGGSDISVLEGIPGSGKTTTMKEVVRQYKKAGYKVIGVAPSSTAALQLQKSTGILSKNATLWRQEWQKDAGYKRKLNLPANYYELEEYINSGSKLDSNTVVIIDEAGMMELSNFDYFLSRASVAGAKVITSGDLNQLPAIGYDSGFRTVKEIAGCSRLEESRRQQNETHREITKLLGKYQVRDAVKLMIKNKMVSFLDNELEANSTAAKEFTKDYIKEAEAAKRDDLVSTRNLVIEVYTNETRRLLNNAVRQNLKEAGVIKGSENEYLVGYHKDGRPAKLKLARGDQVVFANNVNKLGWDGIFNGELATVLKAGKPNEQGLGSIKLLVHKASGRRERVTLDFRDLAKLKWFKQSLYLEHGYAVTAHKVQGDTIDKTIARLEKGTGYEVGNVLLTRHRQDCKIIMSNELAYDLHFEALDKNAKEAKNRFELAEKELKTIQESGLVKLISKRTNTLSATSYKKQSTRQELLTDQDKMIKRYLDACENTIETIRKIDRWRQEVHRKTGVKPKMQEHKEYQLFLKYRKERSSSASGIIHGFAENGKLSFEARKDYPELSFGEFMKSCRIASYTKFEKRLIQLGMNYATIEKHSSQNHKGFELDKVLVHSRDSVYNFDETYQKLLASIKSENVILAEKYYIQTTSEIKDNEISIDEKLDSSKSLRAEHIEIKDAIDKEASFRKETTPKYLGLIYKESGEEILKNYQDLKSLYGKEVLLDKIREKPEILGKFQGVGFGKIFGITSKRKDAIALITNLTRQLSAYDKSGEIMKELELQLVNEDYLNKISILENEIEKLREQLPSELDREFLRQVSIATNNEGSSREKEDGFRELKASDIFASVNLSNMQKMMERNEVPEEITELTKTKIKPENPQEILDKQQTLERAEQKVANEQISEKEVTATVVSNKDSSDQFEEKVASTVNETKSLAKIEEDSISNKSLDSKVKNIDSSEQQHNTEDKSKEEQYLRDICFKDEAQEKLNVADHLKDAGLSDLDVEELKSAINNKQETNKAEKLEQENIPFKYLKQNVINRAVSSSKQIFERYAGVVYGKFGHLNTTSRQMRYGNRTSGALTMDRDTGQWHDKRNGNGGKILEFIKQGEKLPANIKFTELLEVAAKALNVSENPEYIEWLKKNHYCQKDRSDNYKHVNKKIDPILTENSIEKPAAYEWKQVAIPDEEPKFVAAETLKFMTNGKRGNYFIENPEHPHTYRDINGKLLGYIVRLKDKDNPTDKIPMPIRYAQKFEHGKATNQYGWGTGGFANNIDKPIYGIEQLNPNKEETVQNHNKPILIVEGEKTADKAKEMFEDHVVLSWLGGSSAASKVDWSILKGKQVVISPDNDQSGFKAAKEIKGELDKINGYSGLANIVDIDKYQLDKLPEKYQNDQNKQDSQDKIKIDGWDLADKGILTVSQYQEVFHDTRNQGSRTGKILEEQNSKANAILEKIMPSVNYAIKSNILEEPNVNSRSIYLKSLVAIAESTTPEKIDLTAKENFVINFQKVQATYDRVNADYSQTNEYQELIKNSSGSKEKLKCELIKETTILHQLQLGTKNLTNIHKKEIASKAELVAGACERFTDSDKQHAGGNMHKEITSSEFTANLDKENNFKAMPNILAKSASKIDDYLTSKILTPLEIKSAKQNLEHIRSYKLDESKLLDNFKTNIGDGIESLSSTKSLLINAEKELDKHSNLVEEIKTFDKDCDRKSLAVSIMELPKTQDVVNHLQSVKINNDLELCKHGRKNATNISNMIDAIDREQRAFAKLFNTNKTHLIPENASYNAEKAHKYMQDNKIEELKRLSDYSLKNNIETEAKLLNMLSSNASLDDIHYHLDTKNTRHEIEMKLADYRDNLHQSESTLKSIEILKERAKYFENLAATCKNNKIKMIFNYYIKHSEKDLSSNVFAKLEEACKKASEAKLFKEDRLNDIVQGVVHTEDVLDKIAAPLEKYEVNKNLSDIAKEKNKAKNIKEIVSAFSKEEKYLSSLENNLKYPDQHDDKIHQQIKTAKLSKEQDTINKLHHVLTHSISPANSETRMVTAIKGCSSVDEAHNTAIQKYQASVIHRANTGLNLIEADGGVKFNGKSFECPIKFTKDYIHHLQTSPLREHAPINSVKQIHRELVEQQKHLERSKDMGISL